MMSGYVFAIALIFGFGLSKKAHIRIAVVVLIAFAASLLLR